MFAKLKLISVCASAQSLQSSLSILWTAKNSGLLQAVSKDTDQTARIRSLICVFAWRIFFSRCCPYKENENKYYSNLARNEAASRKHAYIVLNPLTPLLYSKTGVYTGIH